MSTEKVYYYTFSHKVKQTPGIAPLECFQLTRVVCKTVKKAYEAAKKYLIEQRTSLGIKDYDVNNDFEIFTDKDFEVAAEDLKKQNVDIIVTKDTCYDVITIVKVCMEDD